MVEEEGRPIIAYLEKSEKKKVSKETGYRKRGCFLSVNISPVHTKTFGGFCRRIFFPPSLRERFLRLFSLSRGVGFVVACRSRKKRRWQFRVFIDATSLSNPSAARTAGLFAPRPTPPLRGLNLSLQHFATER